MSAAISPQTSKLMRKLGLRRVQPDALTIRRRRAGRGYLYLRDGAPIRDARTIRRLARLAVPPAYQDVMFAEDPSAHLQAIGRDAAGRRQYRYHPDWEAVRERRKARRLLRLIEVMPKLRRAIGRHLAEAAATRECALAAVIDLVACSAIRPGSEDYVREHGTRGATTLRKSHVTISGDDHITLSFPAKLGKPVRKEVRSRRLVKALRTLQELPGRRMFQYRNGNGEVRRVQRGDVNAFLRELAGVAISLKDFRTLAASDLALVKLSKTEPAPSERARRRQVREAMQAAADELANTPTICRKSYVHETILTAFEQGTVAKLGPKLRNSRSRARREQVLAEILADGS